MRLFSNYKKPILFVGLGSASVLTLVLFQNCSGSGFSSSQISSQIKSSTSSASTGGSTATTTSVNPATGAPTFGGITVGGGTTTPGTTTPQPEQPLCQYYWSTPGAVFGGSGPDGNPVCNANNVGATASNNQFGYRYSCVSGPANCLNAVKPQPVVGPTPGGGSGAPTENIGIVTSLSKDGPQQKVFSVGQVMYGRVSGLVGQQVAACLDYVGVSNDCVDSAKYTIMPNADWSYDGTYWRAAISLSPIWAGKKYKLYFMERTNGIKSAAYDFEVIAQAGSGPVMSIMASLSRDGSAESQFTVGQTFHGKVSGIGSNAASCIDIVGSTNNCASTANFTTMPNADWSFDGTFWRSAITLPQNWGAKSFKLYFLDRTTSISATAYNFTVSVGSTAQPTGCRFVAYAASMVGPQPDFVCDASNNGRRFEQQKLECRCD